MNLWSRMKLWFKMKTSAAFDQAEDPRQVFDYAYVQQQELLRTVKRGLVEVGTSKYQLEQQIRQLHSNIHVFGHSHIRWDAVLNDTRYVQNPLSYPREKTIVTFPEKIIWNE